MKAIAIQEFGGIEKLMATEIPQPKPASNEVLIEIFYTSVNPVDWKIREGYLKERMPHKFPLILGWDAAGVIAAVGTGVKQFKVGDAVYAYCRKPTIQWGTYAEYVTIEAEHVALKPTNISFAQAAAVPLVGLTAWQSLFDTANLKKDETILIHAGAGGVGSMAIQFAKYVGARVFTTASARSHDYVKKLGADLVIDYTKGFVEEVKREAPEGVDVILDCIGGKALEDSFQLLKPQGRLVSILEIINPVEAARYNIQAHYVFVQPNGRELGEISKLISENKITVPTIEEMRLQEAGIAQEKNRKGLSHGKIVLKIKGSNGK